ncbi:MAG: PKD domain-containing protein [Chthoniobacterales bacterium]
MPVVTAPVLFNTPEADAIVSALQIMPIDNAWNEDIRSRPVLANSASIIAQIKADLLSTRQTLRPFYEMNYVLVPDTQTRVPINFFNYADESDLDGGSGTIGMYPIPPNLPIETWPRGTGTMTLDQWQRTNDGSDRHAIMVAPGGGGIWEAWLTLLNGTSWQASNGAKFNLGSNALRPAGWTSGDAAGLAMFPALVRYDECQRGMVEHALRLIVAKTRRAYVYPATHYASSIAATSTQYPAMGQRLRLKSSFAIPQSYTTEERAVLLALQKYGAIVADNGNFFSISVCPDDRFGANVFDNLSKIDISNFEVVSTTGPNEGPRAIGALTIDAGADQTIAQTASAQLSGAAGNSPAGTTFAWSKYSGPGSVTFSDATQLATTADFSAAGDYTLMLTATSGGYALGHDVLVVHVAAPAPIVRRGRDFVVSFNSVAGQTYRVELSDDLAQWTPLADNISGTGAAISVTDYNAADQSHRFYRVVTLPSAYFFARTTTAEMSSITTTALKYSAPVSCERCASLSFTFSSLPPIFSPEDIRSSTD